MDDDELPKVGCKPNRPVKVAAHKLVPIEETRRIMCGLHVGTHGAEGGAEAECAKVVQRSEPWQDTRVSPHKTKTDQLLEHVRHMLLLARLLQR